MKKLYESRCAIGDSNPCNVTLLCVLKFMWESASVVKVFFRREHSGFSKLNMHLAYCSRTVDGNGNVNVVKIDRLDEEGWRDFETNHGELKSPRKISSVEKDSERERESERQRERHTDRQRQRQRVTPRAVLLRRI